MMMRSNTRDEPDAHPNSKFFLSINWVLSSGMNKKRAESDCLLSFSLSHISSSSLFFSFLSDLFSSFIFSFCPPLVVVDLFLLLHTK